MTTLLKSLDDHFDIAFKNLLYLNKLSDNSLYKEARKLITNSLIEITEITRNFDSNAFREEVEFSIGASHIKWSYLAFIKEMEYNDC